MITWPNFVSQLFNGLALGALLALISSGLTIIYGTLGVLNLAHGAMFMLGGYAGYVAFQATGSFIVAVIAGSLFLVVVGVVMERVIIRHFYGRPHEDQLLVTFGLSICFVEIVRFFFGSLSKTVPPPPLFSGITSLGFMFYPTYRLGRGRHRRGRSAGAVSGALPHAARHDRARRHRGFRHGGFARHRRLPRVHGRVRHRRDGGRLRRDRERAGGFAHARHGRGILVETFVVVVIGGVGSFPGAILGGLIAGEIISLTSMVNPAYSYVMLFAAMTLVLVLRPQGLLGTRSRE